MIFMKVKHLILAGMMTGATQLAATAELALTEQGKPKVAIYVSPEIMRGDGDLMIHKRTPYEIRIPEGNRRKLRESVRDLAHYLQKISGAEIAIYERPPKADETLTPILIGEYARERFGGIEPATSYQQGWRMTVGKSAIGLQGENDESASYAIYELLDRLGCRWFLSGEMGEVISHTPDIRLKETDVTSAPGTHFRGVWEAYADAAFQRRNRMGGYRIDANHSLEHYITQEQREQNPHWRAMVDGKPHKVRLKWSNPEVVEAISNAIIAKLDKQYEPAVSLSPEDGGVFDDTDDRAMDADDWDAAMGQISITDRYIVLCNQIAERVTKKYPDVRFGFLAYVQYTRPPVREKLHPSLIPEIAPINYCRTHCAIGEHTCASRENIRHIVEGWGKTTEQIAYYNYMFHLAEVTAPYPMIRQMSQELPLLYKNNITFWQPETLPNFEQVLPGMWLSIRMAWDATLKPEDVLSEFYTLFYGSAAKSMRHYWELFDKAWTESPEHAGCLWSYSRRFTPEILAEARKTIDRALREAATPMEYQRVLLQERAFRQFERFMQMRTDLNEGRLAGLEQQAALWYGTQLGLAEEYADNYAFSKVFHTPHTAGGDYFKSFVGKTYSDATRMAKKHKLISKPLRQWKYTFLDNPDLKPGHVEKAGATVEQGEKQGFHQADFADKDWKQTDVGIDTWSDMGFGDSYGTMWYRTTIPAPKLEAGKKVFLWIAATDGNAKVFVNGRHIPFLNADGKSEEMATGYAQPFTFDVTDAIKADGDNQITIAGTRVFINELGTGGLLGPAYLFQEK